MGKGVAVDEGSHEAKEKASQKLALSIAIVKAYSTLALPSQELPAMTGLAAFSIALPRQLWRARLM